MAFKVKREVTGNFSYRPWSAWKEGDKMVGEYQSTSTKPDNYGKLNFRFKVLEASFDKKLEGKVIALNHLTQLANLCENLEPGECVQFIYNGKETMAKK